MESYIIKWSNLQRAHITIKILKFKEILNSILEFLIWWNSQTTGVQAGIGLAATFFFILSIVCCCYCCCKRCSNGGKIFVRQQGPSVTVQNVQVSSHVHPYSRQIDEVN